MSSSTQPQPQPLHPCCAKCGKEGGASLKACSACKSVAYCNAECQVAHWAVHKPDCKRIKQEKKEQEKAKEAARSSGSGSGDTSARMPLKRYVEKDLYIFSFG